MDKTVHVRVAADKDLPAILALLEKLGLPGEGLSAADADLWVAEIDGIIVGCAALESDGSSGLLRSVGVEPGLQKGGIGALLVETAHARAKNIGLLTTYLLTTTAEDYFPRFGYRRTSYEGLPTIVTSSSEYSECASSGATVMVRVTSTK